MSRKEEILGRIRAVIRERYDKPSLDDLQATVFPDPLAAFIAASQTAGSKVVELATGADINETVRGLFPEAGVIASNLPEISIATLNPDTVGSAQELNGTDVGIIRGSFGVAENGCIWIPQAMKEKAVCFISENLVILLSKTEIVNNMHEAYRRVDLGDYGYGTFISGPSKTADIAQTLVMGAQAARSVTVVLV
ncbi:MAG: LUD domain-containing protein [Bacteroidales bacterium]|nr:LUD domain-containing protein [Bacteroidales bacterium]